ncbi:unnamed protein product [Arctia plantaginis]|uniref:Uncharacterized protein n=1 Tax=Arctia plantaginis TaxID=874455 RepID=A0A8S0ZFC7_ARCPL|nr:unnamed protein product [Arctia plantaginis]
MKSFSEQHTAHNIHCALEENGRAQGTSQKKYMLSSLKTARKPFVKAVNDSRFEGKTCFIHTLQRAIHGFRREESVNEAIAAGRRIVIISITKTNRLKKNLQLIQTELNVPKHKLIKDVSTRWNSTFYMVERLLEPKRAISLYISDNSNTIIFKFDRETRGFF